MIELIVQIANQVGISANLLLAICTVESNLQNITNYTDNVEASFGLCQVQLSTARSVLAYSDRLSLVQPKFNVLVAALYLKKLQSKYELMEEVVSSYNRGSVKRVDGQYSNQEYVNKVLSVYYDKN